MEETDKKLIQHFDYPKDIDQELVPLLDTINSIPGVRTLFSCSGHGREHFYLVCAFTSLELASAFEDVFSDRHPNTLEAVAHQLPCHFVIDNLGNQGYCPHYENSIGYYSEELGLMSEEARKKVLDLLLDYFIKFVPNKHW